MGLTYGSAIYLTLLIAASIMILKKNRLRHKSVNVMALLFVLMISAKVYYYRKRAMIFESENKIDFTDIEIVVL